MEINILFAYHDLVYVEFLTGRRTRISEWLRRRKGEQEYINFKISQNFLAAVSRAFKSNPRRMILLCLLAAAGVHNL